MSDKLASIMPKILPFLRMLGSGADGEVLKSIGRLREILNGAGLDIYALIERIEAPPVSDEDMQKVFDAGYARRCEDEAEQRRRAMVAVSSQLANGEVGEGVNGYSWQEVAGHCAANKQRLGNWEREFVESVAEQLASYYSKPTEKQAPILRRIFVNRFGGKI